MNNDLENEEEKLEFDESSEEQTEDNIPAPTDIGWSDYVMSYFAEDEKFNGNPTVDSLRRVAELLIGDIIETKTEVIQVPEGNDKRATVIFTIRFLCNGDIIKSFSGAADSYWGNTDKIYNKYPVSMAESRAEGRCLKRALKLKKVITAEEISDTASIEDGILNPNIIEPLLITNNQINFIDIMTRNNERGLNLNVQKLVQNTYPDIDNINKLTHDKALIIIKMLSEFQQQKDNIPSEIIGYNENWKAEFCKSI